MGRPNVEGVPLADTRRGMHPAVNCVLLDGSLPPAALPRVWRVKLGTFLGMSLLPVACVRQESFLLG